MIMKIVFFDIDGTLYDNKNQILLPSTIEALKQLHNKPDVKIAIATGRAGFLLSHVNEILDYIDYYVLINGQIITSKTEVIYNNPIKLEKLEHLIRDMKANNVAYGLEGKDSRVVSKIDEHVINAFGGVILSVPPVDENYYLHNDVYQLWAFCPQDKVNVIKQNNPSFSFLKWHEVGFDIVPITASKGDGVKRLIELLKIDVENVYAFGDGDNDYEMIKFAKYGIAMNNGTEKIKKVAKYITDDVYNDGIYKGLKKFNLI